jgi:uncharacterized protein YigE (DUF2233 family)
MLNPSYKPKTYTNLSFFLALFFCCNYTLAAKAKRINDQGIDFDVFTVPKSEQHKIQFFWKHDDKPIQSLDSLKAHVADKNQTLQFATNGGIFSKQQTPKGLFIQNGTMLSALNNDEGVGNFFLKPNGVLNIHAQGSELLTTENWSSDNTPIYAIQSGPMLVFDSNIHPHFDHRSDSLRIRNGVGIDDTGNLHFVISNQITSLYHIAHFFKHQLHCQNALYLDGTISEMYIKDFRQEWQSKAFVTMIGLVD